jgi:hypothetical protein
VFAPETLKLAELPAQIVAPVMDNIGKAFTVTLVVIAETQLLIPPKIV